MNNIDFRAVLNITNGLVNVSASNARWTLAGKEGRTWMGWVREWIEFLSSGCGYNNWNAIANRSWSLCSIAEEKYQIRPFFSDVLKRMRSIVADWEGITIALDSESEDTKLEYLRQALGDADIEMSVYESFKALLEKTFPGYKIR